MMFRVMFVSLCFTVLCGGCAPLPQVGQKPVVPPPVGLLQSHFEWFDGFGEPDTAKMPLVEVSTGLWWKDDAGKFHTHVFEGFLMADDGITFKVLAMDLSQVEMDHSPNEAEPYKAIGHRRVSWDRAVEARQQWFDARSRNKHNHARWRGLKHRLGHRAEMMFMARAASAHGHDDHAWTLLQLAANAKAPGTGASPGLGGLRQEVAEELAHTTMWRSVLAFSDLSQSRLALHQSLDHVVRTFPNSRHAPRAKAMADLLEQMIREDLTHRPRPWEQMLRQEQIESLIFELRDQHGRPGGLPGGCDIFMDARGHRSPAHQLVQLGFEAVPQLIEAIENPRFTRCVGYSKDYAFSHSVVRVGDAARQIIERIAQRRFEGPRYNTTTLFKLPDAPKNMRVQVEQWWRAVQDDGLESVLFKAVAVGDYTSIEQARALVRESPDKALSALRQGARAAKEKDVRSALVRIASGLNDPGVKTFMREEWHNAPWLHTQATAAAWFYRRHGDLDALDWAIKTWGALPKYGTPYKDRDIQGESLLAHWLVNCGQVDAAKALAHEWERFPVDRRYMVMSAIVNSNSWPADHHHPAHPDALEDLLVQATLDRERQRGMSGVWDGASLASPRLADLAGIFLKMRWPEHYTFNAKASLEERDKQLATIRQIHARRRNR